MFFQTAHIGTARWLRFVPYFLQVGESIAFRTYAQNPPKARIYIYADAVFGEKQDEIPVISVARSIRLVISP